MRAVWEVRKKHVVLAMKRPGDLRACVLHRRYQVLLSDLPDSAHVKLGSQRLETVDGISKAITNLDAPWCWRSLASRCLGGASPDKRAAPRRVYSSLVLSEPGIEETLRG